MQLAVFSLRPLALACAVAAGMALAWDAQAQTVVQNSSKVRVFGNRQRGSVQARGGAGANLVGKIDLTAAAHANAAVMRNQNARNSQVHVQDNQSNGQIGSFGAVAAANAVLAEGGKGRVNLQDSHMVNSGNRARDVHAWGGSGSVAMGVVASANKQGRSLANSQGLAQAEVKNTHSYIIGNNRASQVRAEGGSAIANSVLARESKLENTRVYQQNNYANQISARAGRGAVGGGVVAGAGAHSMAAANSLSVREGTVRGDTRIVLKNNQATQADASGGTALVNSVGVYGGAKVQGATVAVLDNTARNVRTQGGDWAVLGAGRSKNGILVANGVYAEGRGGTELNRTHVRARNNWAENLQADGGRVNANAVAVNGRGKVSGGAVWVDDNRATQISSQGSEATLAGHALDKGVGNSHANALQVHGQMNNSRVGITRNQASNVAAGKGVSAANSVQVGADARLENARVRVAGNTSADVRAENGKTALAASLDNDGRIDNAAVSIRYNDRVGARASSGDALVASVRNQGGARMEGDTTVLVQGNQGHVSGEGAAHSVDNRGHVRSSYLAVAGNRGSAVGGGKVNSLENSGQIRNSTVLIAANQGWAYGGGGLVNSVKNSRSMTGSTVAILGNWGSVVGGGKVNSLENSGRMTGRVVIEDNHGHAQHGGIVNSVVNKGDISGTVLIARNKGMAGMGGVSNSVINNGRIQGLVAVVGNNTVAGPGMTSGSVKVSHGGSVAGAVGVTKAAWAVNGAVKALPSTGVISRSVIVGSGANLLVQ